MRRTAAKKGYTARELRAVSNNPEWTEADFAKARPFNEVFPGRRKGRSSNRASIKKGKA